MIVCFINCPWTAIISTFQANMLLLLFSVQNIFYSTDVVIRDGVFKFWIMIE